MLRDPDFVNSGPGWTFRYEDRVTPSLPVFTDPDGSDHIVAVGSLIYRAMLIDNNAFPYYPAFIKSRAMLIDNNAFPYYPAFIKSMSPDDFQAACDFLAIVDVMQK